MDNLTLISRRFSLWRFDERIVTAAKKPEGFPDVKNIKPLNNHEYGYRMRVGGYRILFNVVEEIQIVGIEEVKIRDERTY